MNEIQRNTLARPEGEEYLLVGDQVNWHTGVLTSGDQLLLVLYFPDILALRFSAQGDFLDANSVPGFPTESSKWFSSQDDERFRNWLGDVHFEARQIGVKRFFLPKQKIGIVDFSEPFKEYLQHPELFDPENSNLAELERQRWSKDGLFELWLNEDTNVWIDAKGVTVAT